MKKYQLLFWIVLFLVALDQVTKALVVRSLALGQSFSVIPNIFEITHVRNKGAAFGFLSTWHSEWRNVFFYAVSAVAMFFLINLYHKAKHSQVGLRFSLSLVLSGALGNILDRIFRGSVVDFLRFHYYEKILNFNFLGKAWNLPLDWPSFNVADMSVSAGAVLLAFYLFKEDKTQKPIKLMDH